MLSSLRASRESIYIPHTGSFTMCSGFSAGLLAGRFVRDPAKNTAIRRLKIQIRNAAERIRTRIESIRDSDPLPAGPLYLVDLFLQFGFLSKSRIQSKKLLPGPDAFLDIFFCIDEDYSLIE